MVATSPNVTLALHHMGQTFLHTHELQPSLVQVMGHGCVADTYCAL